MSSFPLNLDTFPESSNEDIAYASISNSYQTSIVACQTQLESLIAKNNVANQKILALTYKVNAVAMPKWYGNEPERPRLPDSLTENSNSPFCSYGPYSGQDSYVTLNIPNDVSKIPNAQAFHPSNTHFVTVEVQNWASVDDIHESIFENTDANRRKVGGAYAREGLLYHNGVSDLNPKYVLTDWTPLIIDKRGTDFLGTHTEFYTIYTFLVHLVIIG